MKTTRWIGRGAAALLLALGLSPGASRANAVELIGNGGFESGFSEWTLLDQLGSDGSFLLQTGAASPTNGFPVPAPPQGASAAMTDSEGPGSHVLFQDFVVPTGVLGATLRFDRYVNNQRVPGITGEFFSPSTLDFTSVNNQQARVDILLASADPFSVAPADVLLNVFQTLPGDPLVSGYSTVTTDLSSLLASRAGQTLRLRFAEADNQLLMNFGVDAVSLDATTPAAAVPEPGSLCLIALGGGIGLGRAIRRRRSSPGTGGRGGA